MPENANPRFGPEARNPITVVVDSPYSSEAMHRGLHYMLVDSKINTRVALWVGQYNSSITRALRPLAGNFPLILVHFLSHVVSF